MAGNKCKHCGSDSIEEDPTHGYTVCTSCGAVLEDSSIVSQVQFEDNAQGGTSAIGQFVSSESKGGATGFGGSYRAGILGKESREITIQKARKEISRLAQLLRLGPTTVDAACNLYKMALQNNLTKGKPHIYVVSACLYMCCRLEGSSHLLIDFSEAVQVCVFTLGRTFLRLSRVLCISLPFMDPCIYVLRYASQLDFGKQTHAVSMTALRLVSRMKRDHIHTGRRPSGLCGAALLIAARLHDFNRTVEDVVSIVKVHENTLRKRLMEFGNTPSSALSLDEFMTIDLEEEQDPPSFTANKEVLEDDGYVKKLTSLQQQIEQQLEERSRKNKRKRTEIVCEVEDKTDDMQGEARQLGDCIRESTIGAISECLPTSDELNQMNEKVAAENSEPSALGPTLVTLGLTGSTEQSDAANKTTQENSAEVELNDLDEDEIDSYIMTEKEIQCKDKLWMKINASYLQEQKEKKEKLAKEKEGKSEKKRRKTAKRTAKDNSEASTPGEAIERMLVEKNISSKINYDVLRTLSVDIGNSSKTSGLLKPVKNDNTKPTKTKAPSTPVVQKGNSTQNSPANRSTKGKQFTPNIGPSSRKQHTMNATPTASEEQDVNPSDKPDCVNDIEEEDDFDEDHPSELDTQTDQGVMSLTQMMNNEGDDDYYYDGDYDEY